MLVVYSLRTGNRTMRACVFNSFGAWTWLILFVYCFPTIAADDQYICVPPAPELHFLRPPEDDCATGATKLLSRPGAENNRIFVTEQYSTKLPLEIVVPKSWRYKSCLITADLNNGYSLEQASLRELGITAHILALKCLSKATSEFIGAKGNFGGTNALGVLLHGNVTVNGPIKEGNTTVLDDWALEPSEDLIEDLEPEVISTGTSSSRRRRRGVSLLRA